MTDYGGELLGNFIHGKELDHSNCSGYSMLFWNNLIIFFLNDIWEVSNYVNESALVSLLLN